MGLVGTNIGLLQWLKGFHEFLYTYIYIYIYIKPIRLVNIINNVGYEFN